LLYGVNERIPKELPDTAGDPGWPIAVAGWLLAEAQGRRLSWGAEDAFERSEPLFS